MFEFVDISVSEGIDADELWRQWEALCALRNKVTLISNERRDQWKNAHDNGADAAIVSVLWSEYQETWKDFRIVSAWTEIMFSLHTFSETGADSGYLHEAMTVASGGIPA